MPGTRWGDAIVRLLAERGWSRRQLARRARIQPNTLTSIIRHGRHTDTETLSRIAAALEVDLVNLLATAPQASLLRDFSDRDVALLTSALMRELQSTVKGLVQRELHGPSAEAGSGTPPSAPPTRAPKGKRPPRRKR